jgi:hypothetical protein
VRKRSKALLLFAALAFAFVAFGHGQDEPSLGDAARQSRQQKNKDQQVKDAQSKDAKGKDAATKTPKIITNDEIPSHLKPATISRKLDDQAEEGNYEPPSDSADEKVAGDEWRSKIEAQKSTISSMESEIDKLNDSIHFAPANCGANCVQWNERQREKQQQVERIQAQLEDMKKQLEDMQESARKQGYGSSVYDP